MGVPSFSGRGGARIGQGGRHLAAVNTLSAFGRFNERGGRGCCLLSADLTSGGGGGGGCCPLSADLTSGGGGGGGGCCPFSADLTSGGGGRCCPLSADLTSGGGGGCVCVLSTFGRFNERGGGGGRCCPLSADSTIDCIILSMIQRAPPSRPIQSFNQWAEGAEPLLQWGGGGGAIQSRRGGPCPPCPPPWGRPWWVHATFVNELLYVHPGFDAFSTLLYVEK